MKITPIIFIYMYIYIYIYIYTFIHLYIYTFILCTDTIRIRCELRVGRFILKFCAGSWQQWGAETAGDGNGPPSPRPVFYFPDSKNFNPPLWRPRRRRRRRRSRSKRAARPLRRYPWPHAWQRRPTYRTSWSVESVCNLKLWLIIFPFN